MSAATRSPAAPRPSLRRDPQRGFVAGVLAGLGARMGIDPVMLRIAFVIGAIVSGGLLVLAYVVAWLVLPAGDGARIRPARLGLSRVRTNWRVATGVGLLTLSILLAFRELGIWWSDALVWPLVLAAFGASLLWGRFRAGGTPEDPASIPWAAGTPPTSPSSPARGARGTGSDPHSRFADLYRGVFGVLFVIGAALLFLSSNDILGGLRDAALTTVVVIVALALILAPFIWRLGRNLTAERAERIRSQERAELAAHLHDSVLQTLTLMQKRAGDPREVSALARRQERELRDWLSGSERRSTASMAAALRSAAEEIEDDHRVAVEVVIVGDAPLDDRADAVLGAAREALLNAAKHAPEPGPIRVYAEVDETAIEVFVRDRGSGFELDSVGADRRGVRESIIGRMERAGGRAEVRSTRDGGTEVAIEIRRTGAAPKEEQA